MIAVFDIDGVLADASHRQHLVAARPKDWASFFAAVGQDTPIERGIAMLRERQGVDEIVLVSGRPEGTRTDTLSWLDRHGIQVDRLVLRRNSDYRRAAVAKAELIRGLGEPSAIAVVVDDDEDVVETLKALGYPAVVFR